MRRVCIGLAVAAIATPSIARAQDVLDPHVLQERITRAHARVAGDADLPVGDPRIPSADTGALGRASLFNGQGGTIESNMVGGHGFRRHTIVEHIRGLPLALPASESDAIVRGTVTLARAALSGDGSNIYSEFSVRLGYALKAPPGRPLAVGSTLTVLREGGKVMFPKGEVTFRRHDLTIPLVGAEYVLFLDQPASLVDAFVIVTGYRVDGGTVAALDINPQSVAWEGRPTEELLLAAVAR